MSEHESSQTAPPEDEPVVEGEPEPEDDDGDEDDGDEGDEGGQ